MSLTSVMKCSNWETASCGLKELDTRHVPRKIIITDKITVTYSNFEIRPKLIPVIKFCLLLSYGLFTLDSEVRLGKIEKAN